MTPPIARPEPLVLTLEEAMVLLAGQDLGLIYRADIEADPLSPWIVLRKRGNATVGEGRTWVEASSPALGRPVVARDEAAELRAALSECVGTLIELRLRLHVAGRRPETCHEMSIIDDALDKVRRLAGEEERE